MIIAGTLHQYSGSIASHSRRPSAQGPAHHTSILNIATPSISSPSTSLRSGYLDQSISPHLIKRSLIISSHHLHTKTSPPPNLNNDRQERGPYSTLNTKNSATGGGGKENKRRNEHHWRNNVQNTLQPQISAFSVSSTGQGRYT